MPRSTGPPTTSRACATCRSCRPSRPATSARSCLPAPPEQAEPFADVLADLDRVLLPGFTHWNHPRFFAYFSITGSQPGILAELLTATLNLNGMLWRTSPAVTELEQLTLSWMCQLLGFPDDVARPHRGLGLDLDAGRAVRGPHGAARSPRRRRLRARALVHRPRLPHPRPRAPPRAGRRRLSHAHRRARPERRLRRRRRRRDDLDDVGRPRAGDRRCRGRAPGAWLHVDAAYAARHASAPSCARPGFERADSLVVNPHKWLFTPIDCSCLFTSAPDDLRAAFALTPEYLRTSAEGVLNLNEYGPSLGRRFRALKLWAVLRCYGRAGLQATDPRARAPGRAVRGLGARRARLGAVRATAVLGRVLPPRGRGRAQRGAARGGQRERRGLSLAHAPDDRHVLRLAIGNAATTEDDVRAGLAACCRREAARLGAGASAGV